MLTEKRVFEIKKNIYIYTHMHKCLFFRNVELENISPTSEVPKYEKYSKSLAA